MIDIKDVRENPEKFKTAAKDKRFEVDIDRLIELDEKLFDSKKKLQEIATTKNSVGKSIPDLGL